MRERSVSPFWMCVCSAQGVQTAFACPSAASRKESGCSARAALLDTMLMVSIFVIMILPEMILAISLPILAGIVLLAIRQGPTGRTAVPKNQPLFVA